MPWLISTALFHGGKDVDQPFSLSGFLDDLLNPVILAESPEPADKLDFNAVFIRDTLGVWPDLFREGREKFEKSKIRMLLAVITSDHTINLVNLFIRK